MARVAVSNRPNVMRYLSYGGASPQAVIANDPGLLITGDIDIQVLFMKLSSANNGSLVSRLNFFGTQYGFHFAMDNAANRLSYRWSPAGTGGGDTIAKNTGAFGAPLMQSSPMWLRVTHDIDNGASGNDVRFYWGKYDGTITPPTSWTQVGTTQNTAGVTSIFNPPQPISLGGYGNGAGTPLLGGRIYRVLIKNGIDGTNLLDINVSTLGYLTNTVFFDSSGNVNPSTGFLRFVTLGGGVSSVKSRSAASGRVSGV